MLGIFKKIVLVIMLFSFLVFPIVNNAQATTDGILLKDYQFKTLTTQKQKIQNYQYLKDIIILPENDFKEKSALDMINRLGNINGPILQRLVAAHVHVKLFTGKLTNEPSVSYLKGVKPRGYTANGATWDNVPGIGGTKLVLVRIGYSNRGMGHGSINLELHETAHSIDRYAFDLIRDDQPFLSIWHQESNVLFPNEPYFDHYPEEYFAETFAMYYLNRQERTSLQTKAPKTYEYIKSLSEGHSPFLMTAMKKEYKIR